LVRLRRSGAGRLCGVSTARSRIGDGGAIVCQWRILVPVFCKKDGEEGTRQQGVLLIRKAVADRSRSVGFGGIVRRHGVLPERPSVGRVAAPVQSPDDDGSDPIAALGPALRSGTTARSRHGSESACLPRLAYRIGPMGADTVELQLRRCTKARSRSSCLLRRLSPPPSCLHPLAHPFWSACVPSAHRPHSTHSPEC
jgi:hypothetical protein